MLLIRSTVAIEDCSFTNSSVDFSGGAIFAIGGTLHVKSCSLHANTAGGGGGCIWVQDGAELLLANSSLGHCRAGTFGGAVGTFNTSRIVVEDTSISHSTARDGGGVAIDAHASGVVDGCSFAGNAARQSGGAMYAAGDVARIRVHNTTMIYNSGGENGGCIHVARAVQLTLRKCLLMKCTAALNGGAVSVMEDAGLVLGEEVEIDLSEAGTIGGGIYHAGASLVVEMSRTPGSARGPSIQNCSAEFGGGVGFMSRFRVDWGPFSIESCSARKDGAGLYGLGASAALYIAGSAAALSINECSAGRDGGGVALLYGAQMDLGARLWRGAPRSCAGWCGRAAPLGLARNSAGRFGGGIFKQGCHDDLDAKVSKSVRCLLATRS